MLKNKLDSLLNLNINENILSNNVIEEYDILEENIFNKYKVVHLFFYKIKNSQFYFLLEKSSVFSNSAFSEAKFCEISKKIESFENSAMISLARLFVIKYKGLFSEKILQKLTNQEKLSLEDFSKFDFENFLFPERTSKLFFEHIKAISDNPLQYDRIKGRMIYFLEIPDFDAQFLNENFQDFLAQLTPNNSTNHDIKDQLYLINLLNLNFSFFPIEELYKEYLNKLNINNVTNINIGNNFCNTDSIFISNDNCINNGDGDSHKLNSEKNSISQNTLNLLITIKAAEVFEKSKKKLRKKQKFYSLICMINQRMSTMILHSFYILLFLWGFIVQQMSIGSI